MPADRALAKAPPALPAPPPGRTGWPWTSEDIPRWDDARDWPSISIVIPSYRQGDRIEAAIRSVLIQGYPRLELMVFDAASDDATIGVLRRYAPWLAHWESVPDRGQSHAINKGWVRTRGEIFNWLCCDDILAPGSLRRIGETFGADAGLDVLAGVATVIAGFPGGLDMRMGPTQATLALMPEANPIAQPSCFLRRRALRRALPVREALSYAMDMELWLHLHGGGARWCCLDEVLSVAHMTGDNKISRGGIAIVHEIVRLNLRYATSPVPLALWYLLLRLPLDVLVITADSAVAETLLRPLQIAYTAWFTPFYGKSRIKALNAWSGLIALERSTRAFRRRTRTSPSP